MTCILKSCGQLINEHLLTNPGFFLPRKVVKKLRFRDSSVANSLLFRRIDLFSASSQLLSLASLILVLPLGCLLRQIC